MNEHYLNNLEEQEQHLEGYHSEDGNMGIAMHIFDNIGIEFNFVLDIGAQHKAASNVAPIMDKYKIDGLLFDGENRKKRKRHYNRLVNSRQCRRHSPKT